MTSPDRMRSWKMSFIIVWKVAGELVKPKCQGFEEAPVSLEHGFPLVALLDGDIVKAPPDVEFREELGSFQTVDEIVDQREWVLVLHGHCIKHLVVLYEPEAAVLLFDEEDQRCHQ